MLTLAVIALVFISRDRIVTILAPESEAGATTVSSTAASSTTEVATSTVAASSAAEVTTSTAAASTASPVVYFTSDINPSGLAAVYDALNWEPSGKVAVKVTTGEPPDNNYLRADLIGDLVKSVGGTKKSGISGDQDAFLEAMGEAAKSVSDALNGGDGIAYINVMNRLSVDCDCNGKPAEPDMHDIGILASADPVALDQACVDLVYAADDGKNLIKRIESRNGLHTLEHAEKIGLGVRTYELTAVASTDG